MPAALVAYATKNGSTREVAEAVGAALRERAVDVDVRLARTIRDPIDRWDLIVIGAPIYSGRWHRDAHRFLKRHRAELRNVPVSVFGMGPRTDSPDSWQRSRAQLDRALSKRDWLHPVTIAIFGGADPPKDSKSRRDLRDWEAIRVWATGLAVIRPSGQPE